MKNLFFCKEQLLVVVLLIFQITYAQTNSTIRYDDDLKAIVTSGTNTHVLEKTLLIDLRNVFFKRRRTSTSTNTFNFLREITRTTNLAKGSVKGVFSEGRIDLVMKLPALDGISGDLYHGYLLRSSIANHQSSTLFEGYRTYEVSDITQNRPPIFSNDFKKRLSQKKIFVDGSKCSDCNTFIATNPVDESPRYYFACDEGENALRKNFDFIDFLSEEYPPTILTHDGTEKVISPLVNKNIKSSQIMNAVMKQMFSCYTKECEEKAKLNSELELDPFTLECIRKGFYPIREMKVQITLAGATEFKSVHVPGYGEVLASEFFLADDSLRYTIYGPDFNIKYISPYIKPYQLYHDKIKAKMGDRIKFEITSNNRIPPTIKGLPSVHVSGFAAERKFICDPNFGPSQFHPFIPWESHTHEKIINVYPSIDNKGDELYQKYNGFKPKSSPWTTISLENTSLGSKYKHTWTHTIQRRTRLGSIYYEPQYEFSKVKYYKGDRTKPQREGQTIGWFAEYMEYWRQGMINNPLTGSTKNRISYDYHKTNAPKYVLGADVDEVYYIGDIFKDQKLGGLGRANLYQIKTYRENGQANWQHLWENEVQLSPQGEKKFRLEYDAFRYPKKNSVYNDYLNYYVEYKQSWASEDEVYDKFQDFRTYEIEDYNTYFKTPKYDEFDDQTALSSAYVNGKFTPALIEENVWWIPSKSTGNNKHPANIYFVNPQVNPYDENNEFILSQSKFVIPLEVTSPLTHDGGFYGSLKGSQWHIETETGINPKFTLHGLQGLSDEELARFEFEYLVYFKGDGVVHSEGVIPLDIDDTEHFDRAAGTFKTSFEKVPDANTKNGWAVVVVNYKNDFGDKVIVAGRDISISTGPNSLSAPGSVPDEFSETSLLYNGSIDLKEGRGERTNESIKDVRSTPNHLTQTIFPIYNFNPHSGERYTQYTNYFRNYVIDKSSSILFASMDNGRNWSPKIDNYLSWRDHTRKPPKDTIKKNIEYKLVRTPGFYTQHKDNPVVFGQFDYQYPNEEIVPISNSQAPFQDIKPHDFNRIPGDYVLKARYGKNPEVAHSRIRVVDYPSYEEAIDPVKFNQKYKRGTIVEKTLSYNEKKFLMDQLAFTQSQVDELIAFEVKDIYSLYKYVLGPRATTFNHRFGNFNDFDHSYAWSLDGNEVKNIPEVQNWVEARDEGDILKFAFWTDEFGDNLVRHTSSNHFPSEEIPRTSNRKFHVDFDLDETYNPPLDNLFDDTGINQKKTAQRWLPWVAYSPRSNSKLNRWVKTITNLDLFFNGSDTEEPSGKGAWSGLDPNSNTVSYSLTAPFDPVQDKDYYNVREVILGPEWFFGSKGSQLDATKDAKNLYGHLRAGRIIILKKEPEEQELASAEKFSRLKVYNRNSTKGLIINDWAGDKRGIKNTLPETIFISQGIENYTFSNEGSETSLEKEDQSNFIEENRNSFTGLKNGYPILTLDQATRGRTEINSDYTLERTNLTSQNSVDLISSIELENKNPYLKIEVYGLKKDLPTQSVPGAIKLRISTFGTLQPDVSTLTSEQQAKNKFAPDKVFKDFNKISFRARTFDNRVLPFRVTLKSESGSILHTENVQVNESWTDISVALPDSAITPSAQSAIRSVEISLLPSDLHSIFDAGDPSISTKFGIDDVYIDTGSKFEPPTDDLEFMNWVKQSALRYVLWNYTETASSTATRPVGVIIEATPLQNKVSISGLGMGIAGLILAAEDEELLTPAAAERAVRGIVNWMDDVMGSLHNKFKGFPLHYYKTDGSPFFPDEISEVSTIDWAMCAAGLRLARVKYPALNAQISRLLNMPKWNEMINPTGRVAFAISSDGLLSQHEWGLAFSEETDLVHAEAIASKKLSEAQINTIFTQQTRIFDSVSGFFPSYFGAGFTYNWLQLWAGKLDGFKENSTTAYCFDAVANRTFFQLPVIGLTAGTVIQKAFTDGYIEWSRYLSEAGPPEHGTTDPFQVEQIAIMPYGAALAYPFSPEKSIQAFREFVSLGFFHPLTGFPESISIKQFTNLLKNKWFSNWEHYDINQISMAMGIDMAQNNPVIPPLMMQDRDFKSAYELIETRFNEYMSQNSYVINTDCTTTTTATPTSSSSQIQASLAYNEPSKEELLVKSLKQVKRINVSPNPVKEENLHILVKDKILNRRIDYVIIDRGFRVFDQGFFNTDEYDINVQQLSAGSFYIIFKNEEFIESHIFLKE